LIDFSIFSSDNGRNFFVLNDNYPDNSSPSLNAISVCEIMRCYKLCVWMFNQIRSRSYSLDFFYSSCPFKD